MGKRTKLEDTVIDLDERDDTKPLEIDITTQKALTNKRERDRLPVRSKKQTTKRKEKDMKKVEKSISQVPKFIAVAGYSSVSMAWVLDRYPGDLVPAIMAGLLCATGAYVILKK
jgi:hypothetical protein